MQKYFKIKKKIINPYEKLYEAIIEDYLDTEAMIEALESLKKLNDSYKKLTEKYTSISVQMNDLQVGRKKIKQLFSSKGINEIIDDLSVEKEKLGKDIENLAKVIKIATFNMQNQIINFKNDGLSSLNNIVDEKISDNSNKTQNRISIECNKKYKPEESNSNKEIEELNNTIIQLNNKISELSKKNSKFEKEIKRLADEKTDLINKNKALSENNKLSNIKKGNDQKDEMLFSLMKKLENKDNEINKLKSVIPFELKEGEELLTVIFVSVDQKVHYSFICKNSEIFSMVEKRLYEVYPNYEEEDNYFLVNGNKIKKTKTLEENKIKNSDVIMVHPIEAI